MIFEKVGPYSMEKMVLNWDAGLLNKMIGLAFKVNYNISTANLRNMLRLLERCDFSKYQNKTQIMKRVNFLKKALDAKINLSIEDNDLLLEYCKPDTDDAVTSDIITNLERYKQLNPREIRYLNEVVEDRLQFGVIQTRVDDLKKIIERLEDGEYETYAQAVAILNGWIDTYRLTSRNIKTRSVSNEISFDDSKVKDKIVDILKRLNCTSSIIVTGMQMLNEMLSPGYRPEKLYCYLGLPGGFKSALLLKSYLDCIRYNSTSYRPKNPDLKPAPLYVTMENTMDESFARAFNMLCRADDMENYDANTIFDEMKEQRVLCNPNMGGFVVYKPNMSIHTGDLRDMIDDYASYGYEICILIVDYIGRIHSQQKASSEKEELKNVTNELKTLAIDYRIPVVTAHQGNRVGLTVANTAKREGDVDIGKKMDSEFTGSAIDVLQNVDMQLFLYLERRKSDGLLFLSFNRNKERYRPYTKLSYFSQPFDGDNEIRLVDDIMMDKAQGVISLATDMEEVDTDLLLGETKKHTRYKMTRVAATTANTKKNVTKQIVDEFALTPL